MDDISKIYPPLNFQKHSPPELSTLNVTSHSNNMSTIASRSLRQASRLQAVSGVLRSSSRTAGMPSRYVRSVSSTSKDSAQVNVNTAIRADQKAFFAETGKLPENQIVPGSGVNADAMMSPMAGTPLLCPV